MYVCVLKCKPPSAQLQNAHTNTHTHILRGAPQFHFHSARTQLNRPRDKRLIYPPPHTLPLATVIVDSWGRRLCSSVDWAQCTRNWGARTSAVWDLITRYCIHKSCRETRRIIVVSPLPPTSSPLLTTPVSSASTCSIVDAQLCPPLSRNASSDARLDPTTATPMRPPVQSSLAPAPLPLHSVQLWLWLWLLL